MSKGILGRKVGMTQVYDESGKVVPVTVIEAGPCSVLQLRTVERDGYEAVQMGFLDRPRRLASRSERGQVGKLASKRSKRLSAAGVEVPAKPDCEPKRFVREFRGSADGLEVGQEARRRGRRFWSSGLFPLWGRFFGHDAEGYGSEVPKRL